MPWAGTAAEFVHFTELIYSKFGHNIIIIKNKFESLFCWNQHSFETKHFCDTTLLFNVQFFWTQNNFEMLASAEGWIAMTILNLASLDSHEPRIIRVIKRTAVLFF